MKPLEQLPSWKAPEHHFKTLRRFARRWGCGSHSMSTRFWSRNTGRQINSFDPSGILGKPLAAPIRAALTRCGRSASTTAPPSA